VRPRIALELDLLRTGYPAIEHQEAGGEDWFRIPEYRYPSDLWNRSSSPLCIRAGAGYPGATPYAFWVPRGILTAAGEMPGDYDPNATEPPFTEAAGWGRFSWSQDAGWNLTDDPRTGSNLLQWARSCRRRLEEGR
jgi:hypothetical protein